MIGPHYYSYKDPVSRVVQKDGEYYRYIFQAYKSEYDHLMQSGLYQELIGNSLLIPHKEIEADTNSLEVYKLIKPSQIYFQSYPFEWSYSQWRKAAMSFLKINQIAIKFGMILKDATPYNFYLSAGKAIMFDTSSFIFFKENDNWIAYRQFCEEFLSPLVLMKYNGQNWGRISKTQMNGFPLNFVSKQLPAKSWFSLTCLLHIHIHAKYSNRQEENKAERKVKKGFSTEKILSLFSMIFSTIHSWVKPYQLQNHWSGYYENSIESNNYLVEKEEIVREWLALIKPKSVLDLGANTGKFSFIAAEYSGNVIALESDDRCVDEIEAQIEKSNIGNVNALVRDLAAITPDFGVLNKEYKSLFKRGKSELVLALALIHHLRISINIPLNLIVEIFNELSEKYLIVEFISKEDKMAKILLKDKTASFYDYNLDEFVEAFSTEFKLLQTKQLKGTQRTLFLFEKKIDNHESV